MSAGRFRRIVTGHDANGKSMIVEDGPPPRTRRIGGEEGPIFYEIWSTRESPAPIGRVCSEPAEDGIVLAPPARGTRIRILDIPPEGATLAGRTTAEGRAHFAEIGAADAHVAAPSRHPHMHRTRSIDYGIVLEGEITLLLDEGETVVRAGDVVVQCGTSHGWANRSGGNCRIAFILVDGRFDDELQGDFE